MAPRASQNYGSIAVHNLSADDEEECVTLVTNTNGKTGDWTIKKNWPWAVAALLVIGIVVRLPHAFRYSTDDSLTDNKNNKSNSRRPTFDETPDRSTLLSELSPEALGFSSVVRAEDASPSVIWGNRTGPLPTNAWYLVRSVFKMKEMILYLLLSFLLISVLNLFWRRFFVLSVVESGISQGGPESRRDNPCLYDSLHCGHVPTRSHDGYAGPLARPISQ